MDTIVEVQSRAPEYVESDESVVDLLHLDEAGQHQLVLHLDQEHHLGLISMGSINHLVSYHGRGYPPW